MSLAGRSHAVVPGRAEEERPVRSPRRARQASALFAALLLSACASRPPSTLTVEPAPAPAAAVRPASDAGLTRFERHQADHAVAAEARGHWATAILAWEVLTLVNPEDSSYKARWVEARRRVDALAADRRATAEAAQRRGDFDAATQAWLEVLALDPAHRTAAEALRQIERERTRRTLLGRFARNTIARKNGDAEVAVMDGSEQGRTSNSVREHASMLTQQGDLDGAIQLLRDAQQQRSDARLRGLLADLYVQKAESLRQRQPDAARAAVDAALAIDRRHPGALALQQQLLPPPRARPAPTPAPGR